MDDAKIKALMGDVLEEFMGDRLRRLCAGQAEIVEMLANLAPGTDESIGPESCGVQSKPPIPDLLHKRPEEPGLPGVVHREVPQSVLPAPALDRKCGDRSSFSGLPSSSGPSWSMKRSLSVPDLFFERTVPLPLRAVYSGRSKLIFEGGSGSSKDSAGIHDAGSSGGSISCVPDGYSDHHRRKRGDRGAHSNPRRSDMSRASSKGSKRVHKATLNDVDNMQTQNLFQFVTDAAEASKPLAPVRGITKASLEGKSFEEPFSSAGSYLSSKSKSRNSQWDAALAFNKADVFESQASGTPTEPGSPTYRQAAVRKVLSVEHVRREKDLEIMGGIDAPFFMGTADLWLRFLALPSAVLCLLGVVPFKQGRASLFYALFVFAVLACLLAVTIVQSIEDGETGVSMNFCTICHGVGAALGLAALWSNKLYALLGPYGKPLEMYALSRGFIDEWLDKSARRFVLVFGIWLLAGLSRVLMMTELVGTERCWSSYDAGWFPAISFLGTSALFMTLTFCHLHICGGLEAMVDDFSITFYMEKDLKSSLVQWNIIQAIVRRSAGVVESCMLIMQTSVLATLVLAGVEILDGDGPVARGGACATFSGVSVALPVGISLYVLFRAASVTELCLRVPTIVNSIAIDSNNELDSTCFAMVEYITNSVAGFYVKGVRLTAFMVFKLVYVLGLAAVTLLLTKLRQS